MTNSDLSQNLSNHASEAPAAPQHTGLSEARLHARERATLHRDAPHEDVRKVENPESHTALIFAETLRRSKDPLVFLTLDNSRLSCRLLQTLKRRRLSKT